MPVILVIQEAEIRRIVVRSQPGQIVLRDPISNNPITKIELVEWLKVKALSSSPSNSKNKKKKLKWKEIKGGPSVLNLTILSESSEVLKFIFRYLSITWRP
jgi:hypothetical protein